MVIAVVCGMIAGIVSAAWPRSPADYTMMLLAVVGISMPVFWLGMMLQLLFAGRLHWLPVSDMSLPRQHRPCWRERWQGNDLASGGTCHGRHFVLPSFTLATVPMAIIARLTRSSMLEVMGQDYIRTALGQGPELPAGGAGARPAQRADPDRHGDRQQLRAAADRAPC